MSQQAAEAPIVNAWSTNSTVPFFRVGNYAPVSDELTTFDLPVDGAIPLELNGWYLRKGPNPRHGRETPHWFTGDGMIHGVRLENERAAWYRNRWVRTDSFDKPFMLYNKDGGRNLHASVANTNLVQHAGKTLALVESSLPYQVTNDLEALGAYDFGGKLLDSMTAHPKICPRTDLADEKDMARCSNWETNEPWLRRFSPKGGHTQPTAGDEATLNFYVP